MFDFKSLLPTPHLTSFLVISIGYDHVKAAVFNRRSGRLEGVGRSAIESDLAIAVGNAVEAVAAVANKLPKEAIVGIQNPTLLATTTEVSNERETPAKKITFDEIDALVKSHLNTDQTGTLFFSTMAKAEIDDVRVPNPIGVAGKNLQFTTFNAFIAPTELAKIDKASSEEDIDVVKVLPTAFAVFKLIHHKIVQNCLIINLSSDNTEIVRSHGEDIETISTINIGAEDEMWPDVFSLAISTAAHKDKNYHAVYLWGEEHLDHARGLIEKLNWEELGASKPEKIEVLTLRALGVDTELDLAALKADLMNEN